MLRNAHAVAQDHALGLPIGLRHALHRVARKAGAADDLVPAGRSYVRAQVLNAQRMLGDKRVIEQAGTTCRQIDRIALEQRLYHALQHRTVTADADLMIGGGELCGAGR